MNLILNRLRKIRVLLGEMEEQTRELLAIQIGQQRSERFSLHNSILSSTCHSGTRCCSRSAWDSNRRSGSPATVTSTAVTAHRE
jgi:hypothetical protein